MNKRGRLIKYLLITVFIFAIFSSYRDVYAAGEHEFSLKFYDCGTLDEDRLTDEVNPDTNRVTVNAAAVCSNSSTPLIQTTRVNGEDVVKVEKGKVVKVGVHYVPGTNTDIGMQIKYNFDADSFDPVYFSVYNRTSKTYSDKLGTTLGDDFAEFYPQWVVNPANPQPGRITMFVNDSRASAGDPLEDELDIVYFYFRIKEDATMNTSLPFVFDTTTGTGTVMNNKSAIKVTNSNLYVEKPLSTDNTLKTLAVTKNTTNYQLSPTFVPASSSVTNYSTVVDNSVTSVNIEAVKNDEYATLTGTGNKNLSVGNNSFEIAVTSESGDTEVYVVSVYRLSNDDTLKSLSLSNVSFGTFNKDTLTYEATVPYATTSTTVSATVNDTSKATVSGTGNKNLVVGANPISVVVTPENCKSEYNNVPNNTCTTKTYTVNVTRTAASTNNYLSDLKVDGSTVTGFDKETQTYNITVDSSTTSINITGTPEDDKATVSGTGNKNLNVGDQSFNITVTPEDPNGETRDYTINVHKKDSNNNLLSLNVTSTPAGTLDKVFNANTLEYTYTVDSDVTEVIVEATKPESATIIGTGTYNPQTQNKVEIIVTAEDGTLKTYTINLVRSESANANLLSLEVEGYTISPSFNANTKNYTLTVPSTVDKVNIIATKEDSRATLTGDLGEKNVNTGNNTFTVTVTAEDNTTSKEYKIVVTKQDGDATLKSLGLTDITLSPSFSSNTTSYTATVSYAVTNTTVTAEANSNKATVTGNLGNNELRVGENTITVTVTAEDTNITKEYTVNITRETPSTNNYLRDLKVDGSTITGFNKETQTYNITVDSNKESVVLDAELEDTKGTLSGTGTKNLVTGDNSFDIVVTPEDSTASTRTYTVNVYKKDGNNKLESLVITSDPVGTLDKAFNKDITEYTYTVDSDVTEITITATADSNKATVEGNGTYNPFNTDKVEIKVTPEYGDSKTYTINLIRNQSSDADLLSLEVEGYTITPEFNKSRLNYTLTVPSDVTSVNVIATKVNDLASISGDGIQVLNDNETTITVTVTAEDTTSKDYKIVVTKQDADATLKSLSLSNASITPEFNANTLNYTATVPYATTKTTVTAEANSNKATVTGDIGEQNLNEGENTLTITVTAEDTTKTSSYTVVVTRTSASTNNNLSDLKINGESIPGFDPNVTEYTIPDVSENTNSINISATTQDDKAEVNGTGDKQLIPGSNDIIVTVTAEDTTTKDYIIHVNKELNDNNYLATLEVEGFTYSPEFSKTNEDYTLTVPNDTVSIKVVATPEVETSTVSGDVGEVTLNTTDEPTVVSIAVTSARGNIKTYSITVTKDEATPEIEYITSEEYGHIIEDGMIKTVTYKTNSNTLKDQLDNENSLLHVYKKDSDSDELDSTVNLGTAYVIKLIKNDILNDSKVIVVKGDVDGSATITLFDAVKVLNHFLEKEELEGCYLEAADSDSNGNITLFDAVGILRMFLNDTD